MSERISERYSRSEKPAAASQSRVENLQEGVSGKPPVTNAIKPKSPPPPPVNRK